MSLQNIFQIFYASTVYLSSCYYPTIPHASL